MQVIGPIVLLAVAVAGLLAPQLRSLGWLAPTACAALALAIGAVPAASAGDAVRPLLAPLAFIVLAVPMAVMLDHYGLFDELASLLGGGRRYLGALWLLAAATTALLNLDVAVVLLSPLYVRVADRRGESRLAVAVQPALLSCLASSALPVSNLTNLIAVARDHLSTTGFLVHLGLPTAAATGVGWLCYRKGIGRIEALVADPGPSRAATVPAARPAGQLAVRRDGRRVARAADRSRAQVLAVGGALVAAVVVGFVAVPSIGGQPYEVAAAADVVLVVLTRSVPLRVVPWQSVGTVLGLGVLASAAAEHLAVARVLGGPSFPGIAGAAAVSAAGANVVNNLPALLVALPALGHRASWTLWAVLLGTNVGPLAVPSGSLAVLLWLETVRRLGVPVRDRDYLRIGWWIGVPALLVSLAVLLALRALLGAGQ